MAHERSEWQRIVDEDPDHSRRYIERFAAMAREGKDLHGEARLIDAMVGRGARVLDAGAGTGRVGGELARRGHTVVGVDGDPVLVADARENEPGDWRVGDLADLASADLGGPFDIIVSAGNVLAFVAPSTRRDVLAGFAHYLAPKGRAVVGFGAGRGYEFADFEADVTASGLVCDLRLATWDLRPFDGGDFLVAVLRRA